MERGVPPAGRLVSLIAGAFLLVRRRYGPSGRQMVKYATALRLGTAESEHVLRRFTRGARGPDPHGKLAGVKPGMTRG